MSVERLKAIVEKGNLLNIKLSADSLSSTLDEIMKTLKEQKKQILSLEEQINQKCNKDDFDAFKNICMNEIKQINENIPNIDKKLGLIHTEIDQKNKTLKKDLEKYVDSTISSNNVTIVQKMDTLSAEIILMSQSIKNVDKKVGTGTNPKGNDDEIIKKIKSIEDRIQNNQKNATSTQIEDEIQEIKYEIQQLNDKMIDQMISSDYHPPLPIERNVKTEPIHAPIKLNELPTNIETIEENETNEFNEVQNTISHIYEFIEEENHILTSKIERKAENTLVERMFEKLRLMIAKVGEELNDQKKQINKKMGKNEAEKFFSERLKEFLAAGHGKACLVCGSKRINPVQTDIIIKKENI